MQRKLTLNDGNVIPQFGLGLYQLPEGTETQNIVKTALELGYRHLDTAHAYQNETSVGQAIQDSEISNSEIWITSKLWPSDYEQAPEAIERMLKRLKVKQIDLLLLHQQVGNYRKAWIALENAVKEGKVKSIGISNFDGERLVDLFNFADIKPSVIQVETHPYHQQIELQEFLKPYGTKLKVGILWDMAIKTYLKKKYLKKWLKNIIKQSHKSFCVGIFKRELLFFHAQRKKNI
jgi:diketogulonate reductase-like aldo/keto reductase